MDDKPQRILKESFGYSEFREHQLEIIRTLAHGSDAFVLMPTGSGKSICYQVPAMMRAGVGIVVSPLIALMEDQVKGLQENGVRAAYLNSTLSFPQAERIQRQAADGRLDILYVTPEKLLTERFQHYLAGIEVALFAIDEAHCVSQWGHDFRPEYLRLQEVIGRFEAVPRIALTATADAATREDIVAKLGLQSAAAFVSSFDRPNIRYRVRLKQGDKRQLLGFIGKEHEGHAGIVYVRTRKRAEGVAAWLTENGVAARPYHAGMASEARLEHHRSFLENDVAVMVATIAFGMGIDKPDVRFVAHLDLPASMEAYYQETGRAGRDGRPADAWMVYSLADVVAMRRLIARSEGDEAFKRIQFKKLEALLGFCESVVCRRRVLLAYFGEKYPGPCGHCDTCLNPVESWDGTVAAQKALSCVYRTGQIFGAGHLANVLIGKETEQVKRWRHQLLKTFGVGGELDQKGWVSVYRQLLSAGLLSVDLGDVSGFRLTDDSWPVLRGERQVRFRKDPTGPRAPRKSGAVAAAIDEPESVEDRELFEKLRRLRLEIARKLNAPPYIIFHDRSLRAMARYRPAEREEFLQIPGVGAEKARRYGKIFVDCIQGKDTDVSRRLEDLEAPGPDGRTDGKN